MQAKAALDGEPYSAVLSDTRTSLSKLRTDAVLPLAQLELLTSALNAWEAGYMAQRKSKLIIASPCIKSPCKRVPCNPRADDAADCGSVWEELPDVVKSCVVNALQWDDVGKARLVCRSWSRDIAANRECFHLRLQPRCLIAAWAARLAERFPSLRQLRIGPGYRKGNKGEDSEAPELPFEPGSAIRALVSSLPRLRGLSWDYPQLGDEGLAALSKLPALRRLELFPSGATGQADDNEEPPSMDEEPGHVSFPGLAWLGAMTCLESLSIGRISVSQFLPTSLRVHEVPRVIAQIRLLAGLRRLSFGSLCGALDDEMLSWVVEGMPHLQELDCGAAVSVSPAGLRCLQGLRELQSLTLVNAFREAPEDDDDDNGGINATLPGTAEPSKPHLSHGLPCLPSLTALEFPRSPAVTPLWLSATLRSNSSLQLLAISQAIVCFESSCFLGDSTLNALRHVSELRLRSCGLTDTSLRHLSGLPQVRLLDIGGHQCFTPNGLRHLPTTLTSLAILGETLAAAHDAVEQQDCNGNQKSTTLPQLRLTSLTLEGRELGFGLRDQDLLTLVRTYCHIEVLTIVHSRVLSLTILRSALRALPSLRELRLKRCPNYMMEADLLRSLRHDLRLSLPGMEIWVWHEERRLWRFALLNFRDAVSAGQAS